MRDNIKEYEAVAKATENFVRSVAEGDSKYQVNQSFETYIRHR